MAQPKSKENPPTDEQASGIVPLATASGILEITEDRIRQLVKAGFIPPGPRGKVNLVAAIRGYIRFLKDDARKNTKSQAASRATDARTEEIQLRVAERKRLLILREEADLALDLVVGEVNKQFTGLPARITRDVPLRRTIEAKLNEAKGKIAEALARGKVLTSTGVDASDPDAADAS